MKKILAFIKPHKLSKVTLGLHQIEGLTGMSVTDVRGFGRGKTADEHNSKAEELVDFLPHARLEIVCSDEITEKVVATIEQVAHTGLRGDGKIYISAVEEAIRIQTSERGDNAV